MYGAPPTRHTRRAGLTGLDRTNVLGARYSTAEVICAGCASSVTPRTPDPSLGRLWLPVKPVRCIAGNMRLAQAAMENCQ